MAAREPTRLERLREVGRYIDQTLIPSANELPGVVAALVYGDDLIETVADLRRDGLTDQQISHEVAHTIAPPDPDAGAQIVQGVPPEAHQLLLDEVAQLREAVRELTQGRGTLGAGPAGGPAAANAPVQTPGATTANAPPVSTPDTMTAEQQELQALREQLQQLQIQEAAANVGRSTGASEPVPAAASEPPSSLPTDTGTGTATGTGPAQVTSPAPDPTPDPAAASAPIEPTPAPQPAPAGQDVSGPSLTAEPAGVGPGAETPAPGGPQLVPDPDPGPAE